MSIKRRRIVKLRTPLKAQEIKLKDKAVLLNEVRKNANKVNQRLKSLERAGFKTRTWASKKLINRIDTDLLKSYNRKTKRVKVNKNLSTGKLKALNKSLTAFLQSETSTRKGINNIRKKTIESLRNTLSDYENELSYDEAETLYDMLGDKDFSTIVDYLGGSESLVLLNESISQNDSFVDFKLRMQIYMESIENDQGMNDRLKRIYEKIMR